MISLAAVTQASQVRVGWRTNVDPSWAFDLPAIAQAARTLGITGEIHVGCAVYRRGRWAGMYSHERGVHRIRVAVWADAENASRTLWHELTHALQYERGDDLGTTQVRREQGYDAYLAHPAEVEARANERLHEDFPLTTP